MTSLPGYRRAFLRIMVRAASPTGEVGQQLGRALAVFGAVDVSSLGRYYKDETLLEFRATLEPAGRVGDCIAALRALAPEGWRDSPVGPAWVRPGHGRVSLLHPELEWVTVSPAEAAVPPRFVPGDLVRILDCRAARDDGLVGEEAEIRGSSTPATDADPWGYAVRPSGWDTLICFDEPDLAPTGRRVSEAEPVGHRVISVQPNGTVTGSYVTPSQA
ncbi:hypothetical protein [Amycolatopsis thermoflava]|uniref:hypothetical protein n=1 Tax=Amycolatopsis thermoflava TaxID=84480 RepID=UPI0036637D4F